MSATTLSLSITASVVPAVKPRSPNVPELSDESLSASVMSMLVPTSSSLLVEVLLPSSYSCATIDRPSSTILVLIEAITPSSVDDGNTSTNTPLMLNSKSSLLS